MMETVIDLHSHILPRMDDGSESSEMSVAMLKMEAEQGIRQVIATPHFYPQQDAPERFLDRRDAAAERLRAVIGEGKGLPELFLGAEVYFFRGISDSDMLSRLTIDKKRCIMVEMPLCPWTDAMYQELEDIHYKQGLTPIIAHVDRYISPFRSFGIPQRLAQMPVLVQANADFFLHRATRGMALRMLKKGQIHLLGSDCHNLSGRAPNLGQALDTIRQHNGEASVQWIRANERKLFE